MNIQTIKENVTSICQDNFTLEGIDRVKVEKKIEIYLEKIKNNYHHIEYDVQINKVLIKLFTSKDDGYQFSVKISRPNKVTG